MAETDFHRVLMVELYESLQDWYRDRPDVYATGNLLLFYEEGNRRRHVAPDVFVVLGVPNRKRDNYLLWEEGRGPNLVIELTSTTTRREDLRKKMDLYRDVLRVPEYFLFDPRNDYLEPRFQGFRLSAGEYRPMRLQDGRLRSRQLDLWLEPDGDSLRWVNPATGQRLPTRSEAAQASERARLASDRARDAAEQAERVAAELARTEAAARQRAEAERARAEAENERLRAELAALRKRPNGRNGH